MVNNKNRTYKFLKIILSILIILLPYIYAGTITGNKFLPPMYEVFYISKILCSIVGIYLIVKEI